MNCSGNVYVGNYITDCTFTKIVIALTRAVIELVINQQYTTSNSHSNLLEKWSYSSKKISIISICVSILLLQYLEYD